MSSGLRDLIKRARTGEMGADMVASDAILTAGYTPERAGQALKHRPIPDTVRANVRRVQDAQAAKRAKSAARAAERVPANAHRKANDAIFKLTTNRYFNEIPLGPIMEVVEKAGFRFDPEEVPLFLTGRSGRLVLELFGPTGKSANKGLMVQWHKMETTGRYEIVAYVN